MAARVVARRLSSQLPRVSSPRHEQVISARAFASATAKAQDDSSVEVGHNTGSKGHDRAVTNQGSQERAATNQGRGWPGSVFPSLFSPSMSFPSSIMRPTSLMHMMDAVDRLFPSVDMPSTAGLKSRIPWDVMEDDKSFKLRMDLPGMSKQDVKMSVEDGDLVVKAEHKQEQGEDDWSSRSYGAFSARITLPDNVDFNGIKAEMKDGVLKVQAPKVEGAKQKHEVLIE